MIRIRPAVLVTLALLALAAAPPAGAAKPNESPGKGPTQQPGGGAPTQHPGGGTPTQQPGGGGPGLGLGLEKRGELANTTGEDPATASRWLTGLMGVVCLGGAALFLTLRARTARADG